jgi:3-hydroxyacyl-[acyl-carrier-protein] dehydratase
LQQPLRRHAWICIDGAHPALPGHFPGRPVVPAVVVLDHVLRAAESELGAALRVCGLPQVKFAAPLRPGERAECAFELSPTRLEFRVERNGQPIAYGSFALLAQGGGASVGDAR